MSKHIKATARGLAALGRGPDTMLIHMAPSEVGGLQELATAMGGSLTVNPHTGLPEAGILSSILPMVLGGAAMFIPGMQPVGAALIGGATGLLAGDKEQPWWMRAGLGALGGYGGGALASTLGGAAKLGTAAAAAAPTAAPAAAATTPGAAGIAEGVGAIHGAAAAAPGVVAAPSAALTAEQVAAANAAAVKAGMQQFGQAAGAAPKWDLFKTGVSQFAQHPMDTSQAMLANMNMGGKMGVGLTGLAALDSASTSSSHSGKKDRPNYYMTSFDPKSQKYGPGVWTTDQDQLRTFLANNQMPVPGYAGGGLASLNSFSGGRFIQGPGDGVSDSIPAAIHQNGKHPQRAALGDGEFVVDARTVSELGNGSSAAGARRLYAMVHNVQKSRRKAKLGKDSNAARHLPA